MTKSDSRNEARPRTLGAYSPMLVLLLLASLAIEEGLRLIVVVDPAAQADMAGWYVFVLGVILAVTAACGERPSRTGTDWGTSVQDAEGLQSAESTADVTRPTRPYRDIVVCLLLVAAYAALLDPLGYAVAGILVVFVFLRVISRYGWIKSLAYTAVMNTVLILLFELAGVVLPSGILRF